VLKSSSFRDFQQPEFDRNLRKIAKFQHMVQSRGSQKKEEEVCLTNFTFMFSL
jgi:hypothetical protein